MEDNEQQIIGWLSQHYLEPDYLTKDELDTCVSLVEKGVLILSTFFDPDENRQVEAFEISPYWGTDQ